MQIPIERAIERVRGPMVVPPLLKAPLATLSPGTPDLSGSSTGTPFSGALAIVAPAGRA